MCSPLGTAHLFVSIRPEPYWTDTSVRQIIIYSHYHIVARVKNVLYALASQQSIILNNK